MKIVILNQRTQGDQLDAIETASEDELRSLQLQRLKWSLQHAYDKVPNDRRSFDAADVRPDDLKQLSNLSKFPFTSTGDLRDNYPFGLLAVPRRESSRFHDDRQADGSWIHLEGHLYMGECGGSFDPCSRGMGWRHATGQMLRLSLGRASHANASRVKTAT